MKVHYEGLEHLRHPAVLTFNHSTYLDFLANAELVGSRCLVFGKRSLARLPFLGWGWLLGGHPLIRRDDRDHWQGQLDRVERLLKHEGYSTCVAKCLVRQEQRASMRAIRALTGTAERAHSADLVFVSAGYSRGTTLETLNQPGESRPAP